MHHLCWGGGGTSRDHRGQPAGGSLQRDASTRPSLPGALPVQRDPPVRCQLCAPPEAPPDGFFGVIGVHLSLGQPRALPARPWRCTWASNLLPPGLALLPAAPRLQEPLPASPLKGKAKFPSLPSGRFLNESLTNLSRHAPSACRVLRSAVGRANMAGFLCDPLYFILCVKPLFLEEVHCLRSLPGGTMAPKGCGYLGSFLHDVGPWPYETPAGLRSDSPSPHHSFRKRFPLLWGPIPLPPLQR